MNAPAGRFDESSALPDLRQIAVLAAGRDGLVEVGETSARSPGLNRSLRLVSGTVRRLPAHRPRLPILFRKFVAYSLIRRAFCWRGVAAQPKNLAFRRFEVVFEDLPAHKHGRQAGIFGTEASCH